LAVLVAAGAVMVCAATANAQATRGEIAACVRDNLVKYAPPDRAVVDQYLSIEAACQAYLDGDPSAQITVTPLGGGASAGAGTSGTSGSSSGDSGSGGTTTSSPGATASGSGGSGDGSGGSGSSGGGSGSEARGSAPGGGDAAALAASAKIAPADAGSPSAVSAITDAPIWLLLVLGLVVAGVVAGVVMGVRRQTR